MSAGTAKSLPTNANVERYIFAQQAIGIPFESLHLLERDVYEKFLSSILEVSRQPDWTCQERYSSQPPGYPGGWLWDFSVAYNQCLQNAVADLAELLAKWVLANRRRKPPIHAKQILQVCFLFAGELASPKFTNVWLAQVAAKTRGPEIPTSLVSHELALDCYMLPNHDDLLECAIMPNPEALDRSILVRFWMMMRSSVWKGKAQHMATRRIQLSLLVASPWRGSETRVAIEMPPLTQDQIRRRDSLSAEEAGRVLGIKQRRIRDYLREKRLDKTKAGRVHVNEKFWREYTAKHLPDKQR